MKAGTISCWVTLVIALAIAMACSERIAAQVTTIPGSTLNDLPPIGIFGTDPLFDSQNLVYQNTNFQDPICLGLFASDSTTGGPIGRPYAYMLPARAALTLNVGNDLAPKLNFSIKFPTINAFNYPVTYRTTPTGTSPTCVDPPLIPLTFSSFDRKARSTLRGENMFVYEAFTSATTGTTSYSSKNPIRRRIFDPKDVNEWGERGGGEIALGTFLLLATGFELLRRRRQRA